MRSGERSFRVYEFKRSESPVQCLRAAAAQYDEFVEVFRLSRG